MLDALSDSGVLPADLRQEEADHAALDAVRHVMADWQAPGDARPLVERAAAQAIERVESALPTLVAEAVERALAEEG